MNDHAIDSWTQLAQYARIARRCRNELLGYQDSVEAGPEDVQRRLDEQERNLRRYSTANTTLHAKLSALEER